MNCDEMTNSKAESKCWLDKHPKVKGVVMNSINHLQDDGEDRAPISNPLLFVVISKLQEVYFTPLFALKYMTFSLV